MSKHTAGPWIWQHWPDGQNTVAEQSTLGTIANVWTSGAGVEIDRANARLIAAAPELLALAVRLEPMLASHEQAEKDRGDREHTSLFLIELRAAIAKATGGAL